jgi:hypothetical protein
MTAIWTGGEFTGDKQPMARVTIQKMHIQLQKVDKERLFSTAVFGQGEIPRELPNIKSVEWERSVGADVATCTIVLYNTAPLPLGDTPPTGGDFDLPGYYTFNYGATSWSNSRWGHEGNAWQDWLMPDRLIRTYEGYGFDPTSIPENDAHLVQTGVWLIDDVEFTHDGLITVTCRDIGRLLLDQIMFPPVIPLANYPLEFQAYHQVDNPDIVTTTGSVSRPSYAYDSGAPYNGANASLYGHRASDAFDGNAGTYWLSVGNALPSAGYSFEFVEGAVNGTVSAVTVHVWGGPYKAYLSLRVGGKWTGRSEIPYDENNPVSAPNGSDINYVASMSIGHEATRTFKLANPVANVERVRVTFTNLFNSGIGPYRYRAGVREITVSSQKSVTKDGGTHTEGDYGDYSEIVRYLLASGGFHWPRTSMGFLTKSDGSTVSLQPSSNDPYLKSGRVWGDIETAGTAGPAALGVDIWDKKPLMDGIAYVRDILSYIFFIDETGGAVFRIPNIWSVGNYVGDFSYNAGRTSNMVTIDERQTLLGLRAKISSRNIRENVFVANTNGRIGAVAAGFNPINPDPGMRRVAGWTDQHFATTNEAQVMADLITVRQMFEFRSDSLTIVGNPAIQIDDQVKIFERTTNEGYIHYVKSIKSTNDLEAGKWTYDLDTHWLGEAPFSKWAFDPTKLSAATQTYLAAIGKL